MNPPPGPRVLYREGRSDGLHGRMVATGGREALLRLCTALHGPYIVRMPPAAGVPETVPVLPDGAEAWPAAELVAWLERASS